MTNEFRKRPTVVEAMQWDGSMDSQRAIVRWGEPEVSGWFDNDYYLEVRTAGDGRAKARAGDWIVRQKVNGRWDYWPVAAAVFAATYDPVAGEATPPLREPHPALPDANVSSSLASENERLVAAFDAGFLEGMALRKASDDDLAQEILALRTSLTRAEGVVEAAREMYEDECVGANYGCNSAEAFEAALRKFDAARAALGAIRGQGGAGDERGLPAQSAGSVADDRADLTEQGGVS